MRLIKKAKQIRSFDISDLDIKTIKKRLGKIGNNNKHSNGINNWIKLIKKIRQIRSPDLSTLDLRTIKQKLNERNAKTRQMEIYGLWNILARKLLLRYSNLLSDKTQQRWHRLILKLDRKGLLNLKSMYELDTTTMISKLKASLEKQR